MARRSADKSFEGAAKRGFRLVAYLVRNGSDLGARIRQAFGRNLHAPPGQILYRRTADQLDKTIGQYRARRGCFLGKRLQSPGAGRMRMRIWAMT